MAIRQLDSLAGCRRDAMRKTLIIAVLLIVLAAITVVSRYELDIRLPAVSMRLAQPAAR